MFLSNFSINRPVTITMLILVFVVFGILAYVAMPLNLMPDVELPFVTIQTVYAGAGPQEIETQITKKIEDAVSTISNIDYIESYSMDNLSLVLISFELEKDIDLANQEVKDKVDVILNDLPTDADKPIIDKFDITAQPVVRMVLSGVQSPLELYEYADKSLKDRLSQIEGVAQVEISGGQEREIQVVLNERTTFSNDISLSQLSQILALHNVDLPSGNFKLSNQELSVKVKGEIKDIESLKNLDIPTAYGVKKLSHIADIIDAGAEIRQRTTFFDLHNNLKQDNVISINLVKSADGNPVDIAESLKEQLAGINKELPEGMELTIVVDDSIFIASSVDDTLNNIILGIIFTGLVLLFFLHDLRSTLIVALTMPISIIATFVFMQMAGFTMNMMSLLGLSTSVGVLVTNSVVVLENIFRHKELGHGKKESAGIGTSEIAIAVFASAMTNIVVFLPIGSMGGIVGQFFKEFALTVTFATIFSLIIAFTLTPMLASLILPERARPNIISKRIEAMLHRLENAYKKILIFIMKRKTNSTMTIVFAVALFIFSLFVATKVGFEFIPTLDEGNITIKTELPIGYNLEETSEILENIENIISVHPEIKYILTNLGTLSQIDKSLNMASTSIKLVDADLREKTTQQVADMLIKELSNIPNAKISVNVQSSVGSSGDDPVSLYLIGYEDEKLLDISQQINKKIKDVPGLINLDSSTRSGKPEITIEPKRDKLAMTGNTVTELALAVRTAIEGMVSTQYKEAGNEYDIKVTMPEESYNSPEKLKNLTITTSTGKYQLSQLANVNFTEGVNKIIHRDKAKTIKITGAPAAGIPLGVVTDEIDRRIADIELPEGYKLQWGGSTEIMKDSMQEMLKAAILAILLTYMLLAAILESFIQPFMILSTVPLALIGVFFIQYLTGLTMNIISMMSIIMLVGIVVNNAILILDYANLLRKQGRSVHDALIEACPIKLKPILMSNLAIMLGMLPMAIGIGSAGKEFRQSMGVVSIGGLVMSTILTLFVIPTLYYVTTKAQARLKK
jgi:HAE1 family hydrophobic/amphiphilic exporter-1